jgi:hypothetical protein
MEGLESEGISSSCLSLGDKSATVEEVLPVVFLRYMLAGSYTYSLGLAWASNFQVEDADDRSTFDHPPHPSSPPRSRALRVEA